MKQLLPVILTLLLFPDCGRTDSVKQPPPVVSKIDPTKQPPPVVLKNDTATENLEEGLFICRVPQAAEFPGGAAAWQQFLQQNLIYPDSAVDQNVQGIVTVQFTVCTDGSLCDIEAISGPNELKESAVQVFKRSPKWIPARDNGRDIKDHKRQPIVFKMEEE